MSDSFDRQLRYVVHRKLQGGAPIPPDATDDLLESLEPVFPPAGMLESLIRLVAGKPSPTITYSVDDSESVPLLLVHLCGHLRAKIMPHEKAAVLTLRAGASVADKIECAALRARELELSLTRLPIAFAAIMHSIPLGLALSDGLGGSEQVD